MVKKVKKIVPKSASIFGESEDSGLLGNSKKQPNKAKSWFFTYNNYMEADIQIMKDKFDSVCERYIFEKEVGESGTPHLQGVIFLKEKMRWSELKLMKEIHWLLTKDEKKSIAYYQKEFHWTGNDIFYKGIELIDRRNLEIPVFNSWVNYIEDVVKSQICNKRLIHWFWSEEGEFGKTTVMKYLNERYGAILISSPNTANNMMNLTVNSIIDTKKVNSIVINLPRSFKASSELYTGLETIKDGICSNMKSHTNKTLCFVRPHIFIFANWRPKSEALSSDRWCIHNIDYMKEIKSFKFNQDPLTKYSNPLDI